MPAPHHSVFTGRMLFLPPNQQRQSTEGIMQNSLPILTLRKPGFKLDDLQIRRAMIEIFVLAWELDVLISYRKSWKSRGI